MRYIVSHAVENWSDGVGDLDFIRFRAGNSRRLSSNSVDDSDG
jgi:hypothetical protein